MKWISVKDRLPKYEDEYLVVVACEELHTRFRDVLEFTFDDTGEMVFVICDDNGKCYPCRDVTHWQPLPEFPLEDCEQNEHNITEKSADVVPVVHGKWGRIGEIAYQCSVCKNISINHGKHNYCYECGAKMDGEQE